jgi:hypothetical protein
MDRQRERLRLHLWLVKSLIFICFGGIHAAVAVLAQAPAPAQVRLDARLREMHLGVFQGLTVKEILAQFADEFDAYRYARGSGALGRDGY